MSESKVPLPTPIGVDEQAGLMFNMKALCAYGDARAAEARRLALDVEKVQAFEANVRADERRKALLEAAEYVANLYSHEGEPEDDMARGADAAIADAAGGLRALADETQPNRSAMSSADSR